jgi:hypothetical protein
MTTEIAIDFSRLNQLFEATNQVGDESADLADYFRAEVCDPSGFDYELCALKPIADMLPKMAGWFDEAVQGFGKSWMSVQHGIYAAARHLEQQDDLTHHALLSYRANDTRCATDAPSIENYHLRPIKEAMGEPEAGGETMSHDSRFDAAAEAWETARDTINDGIDLLNNIGAGITPLSDKSLRDYIVYPLAADYTAIRRNADACKRMKTGFDTWGHNFGQLAAKTPQSIRGETGVAVMAVFKSFDVCMGGVGDAISLGSLAFDGIARVSERIAVEVEKALVLLGTKITKLASKVGTRVIPFAGELIMAFNAIKDLLGGDSPLKQFQDILDDIETVRKIIEDCFNLADTIKEWAQVQAHRLDTFHDVLDTLGGLPVVEGLPGLKGLSHEVGRAEHSLDDVNYGVEDHGERGDLDHELGGLAQQTGSESADEPVVITDPDDDPMTDGDLDNGEYGDFPPVGSSTSSTTA